MDAKEEGLIKILDSYPEPVQVLRKRLRTVPDYYLGFDGGVSVYAKKGQSWIDRINTYMDEHEDATTSDILDFMATQPDFFDGVDRLKEKVG